MSDYGNEGGEEFECEWPSDNENDQDMGGPEIDMQNTFYTAEDAKRTRPAEAIEMYENVAAMAESIGEHVVKYRFDSYKNIIVLSAQLQLLEKMVENQRNLLTLVTKVTKEELSEAVNNVLDAVANHLAAQPDYQKQIYKMTLDKLRSNNESIWFKTCLSMGKIYQDLKNFDLLDQLLSELKESCRTGSNTFDNSKANNLLEVFAMEIQMCSSTKNNARMKAVYHEAQKLSSVNNDPRIFAIIKETGGKVFMGEKKWDSALNEMFDSFKDYQEIGNTRAKTVLKYVILASILSGSQIDYAETREAKVYIDDPQIQAIVLLRKAYEKNDINTI